MDLNNKVEYFSSQVLLLGSCSQLLFPDIVSGGDCDWSLHTWSSLHGSLGYLCSGRLAYQLLNKRITCVCVQVFVLGLA